MDVFQLWGQIAIDNNQANSAIDGTTKKATTFGEVLKANLASEAIIAGVKKLASAVVEIGTAAYESYAEYEQLAGGAELMFGEAYATVAQNAKKAYKTVQMSQNEYLTQVNGLATGLKTALGGNAQAAAELADKVITAEADVVAATGNSQEAVQNAFNGIMKSNYTMLDNLQLGITPTKEGFQEVIDKVNEWNEAQGNATNYTIDNLADCQSALVDYIEMQGLAGYAANEAADTIQGSTASMKAAWANLATGMADETADMEQLTKDFVDSVGTAAKNILPRVQQIVTGVGTATVETISYLRETNETIDLVISVVEDLGIVSATTGAVLAANFAGQAVKNIATVFIANAQALAYFTAESGKAAVAQATLNGAFSVGEVVVGLLTGKITAATAAQYAWNTAMNANPLGIVIAAVSALGIAAKVAYSGYKEEVASLAESDGTLEGLVQRHEELTTQLAEYERKREEMGGASAYGYEIKKTKDAIAEVQTQIESLTSAEEAAAVAAGEITSESIAAAKHAAEQVEIMETAAQDYADAVQGILEDYYDTYNSIYEGLHNVGSAFTSVTEKTEITWEAAMENMAANTALLEGMDDNFEYITRAASDARINIDGFSEMLASMSTEDAAGLLAALRTELEEVGPTSGDAANTLQSLADSVSSYSTAGQDYSQSLALIVEDVDQRINDATDNYKEAVAGLDQEAEAIEAAQNTMTGLVSGITHGIPKVLTTVDSLASQMKTRLETSFSDFVLNIQATVSAKKDGSNKNGLDYVPFDGYISELHKGEAVLTAAEARAWRAGKAAASQGSANSEDSGNKETGRGVTVNQYIQAVAQTPVELAAATEAYFQQARWAVAL